MRKKDTPQRDEGNAPKNDELDVLGDGTFGDSVHGNLPDARAKNDVSV
jgi:hypothetical protein